MCIYIFISIYTIYCICIYCIYIYYIYVQIYDYVYIYICIDIYTRICVYLHIIIYIYISCNQGCLTVVRPKPNSQQLSHCGCHSSGRGGASSMGRGPCLDTMAFGKTKRKSWEILYKCRLIAGKIIYKWINFPIAMWNTRACWRSKMQKSCQKHFAWIQKHKLALKCQANFERCHFLS